MWRIVSTSWILYSDGIKKISHSCHQRQICSLSGSKGCQGLIGKKKGLGYTYIYIYIYIYIFWVGDGGPTHCSPPPNVFANHRFRWESVVLPPHWGILFPPSSGKQTPPPQGAVTPRPPPGAWGPRRGWWSWRASSSPLCTCSPGAAGERIKPKTEHK